MYKLSKHVFPSITYLLLPRGPYPRHALPSFLLHPLSPLLVRQRGSGHPDPDFRIFSLQHSQQPCSRSTNRRKAPCHGFHDSNR